MNYTVTITPDDGVGAETVVKLAVNGSTPRITELKLTAGDGGSLSTAQLPAINLELLLAAVLPAAGPTMTAEILTAASEPAAIEAPSAPEVETVVSLPTTAPVATVTETNTTPRIRSRKAAKAPASKATRARATPTKSTTAKSTAAKATTAKSTVAKSTAARATTARATAATATTGRAKATPGSGLTRVSPTRANLAKKAAAKATPTKAPARATAKKAAAQAGAGRAYRNMPDDFAGAYHQASTVAALADVYDVPRHTAQGWINTARKRGIIPPARRRAAN